MRTFYFLALATLIASCSKKGIISMNVQEPAEVRVPAAIKKLGIVNRTLPTKETKPLDDIEKALSLEGKNLDKDGAESSVNGLKNELSKNDRFPELKIIDEKDLKTIGAGMFPAALNWEQVAKICKAQQVDGLVSLEFFDTNTKLNFTANTTTVNTPLGNVPAINHHATMITTVNTGWRFYDPIDKRVLDEYRLSRSLTFTSNGINPLTAAKALIDRKEAVNQASSQVAEAYAGRLVPYWIRVSRDYYLKGNDQLKMAARKAQAGNWDGAAQIWKNESANSDPKIAGRACYNYAIIHEINGDLDEAIKWAQKAYEDFNEKLALNYVRVLQNRKERIKNLNN